MPDPDDAWLADPLHARAERTPERTALVDAGSDGDATDAADGTDAANGGAWTYAAFDALVDQTVATLIDAGVAPGGTVATLLDSRPLAVALCFAAVRHGVTLAPLNVGLDEGTIADQCERLGPSLVLCEASTEAAARAAFDGSIGSVDPPQQTTVQRFNPTDVDRKRTDATAIDRDAEANDPERTALVAFTSGTTGRPKGVRLTVGNLLASAVASAQRLGVTPRDRWLSPLSTYHVGGIAPYLRSTLYGTTAILQREFDAAATVTALEEYDATCVSFVPTMLSRVLDAGWRPSEGFRFVLLGGGPAPESLLERSAHLDVPVCPTYGTTETASQVATATPGEAIEHFATVGRPLHGADVRIEDENAACDVGEVGELVVSGPMVSPGYLDSEATVQSFEDGALRTGDRGYRDAEGRLWIVGRADDVIVSGGENVQPATVAAALSGHAAVEDVAVVGVPDEEWGERVVALVEATTDVDADALTERARGRLPDYAIPKSVTFTDRLPRTPSGTIDRAAVRRRFE